MSIRAIFFVLALVPAWAAAQGPAAKQVPETKPINATTRAVLLANRPVQFTEAEWL